MPFRRALLLALAVIAALPGPAAARIGVTSAASGDPLGQPPAASERVLRVGIDVEANERVTTRSDDRAHLVFLDGTSITIGPNSSLTIDKFVFDPNTDKGDLALTAAKGVFRLVGGKISKSTEVTIATPSATIGIRGGIIAFAVADDGKTTADFLHGDLMRVTAQGATQSAKRVGSRIEVAMHKPPSTPALLPRGALSAVAKSLEKPASIATAAKTPAPAALSASIEDSMRNSKLLTSKEGREIEAKLQAEGKSAPGQKRSAAKTSAVLKLATVAHRAIVHHAANNSTRH